MHFSDCDFVAKVQQENDFYLPVIIEKPKFVAFLVFALIVRMLHLSHKFDLSENVSKRDAILAPVANREYLAKDWFRVTLAQKNAQKLLFTDLVSTKKDYPLGIW